jgi:hypothetical protein
VGWLCHERIGRAGGQSSGSKWTQQRLQAAQFVADDHLIDEDIAAKVGISSKQLVRWKKQPEFKAK